MKKYLPLIAFALVCPLSMLLFYVVGLPLERGVNAALWMLDTLLAAVGAGILTYMRPDA